MLLDKQGTKIEFKKTEISELKIFLSLIKESYLLFRNLVRNPSSLTVTKEVQRSDRIMGSINLQKTFAIHLRYPDQKNTVNRAFGAASRSQTVYNDYDNDS